MFRTIWILLFILGLIGLLAGILVHVDNAFQQVRINLEIEVPYHSIVQLIAINGETISRENKVEYNIFLISGKKYNIEIYFRDEDIVTKKVITYIPTKEKYQYLKVTGK